MKELFATVLMITLMDGLTVMILIKRKNKIKKKHIYIVFLYALLKSLIYVLLHFFNF